MAPGVPGVWINQRVRLIPAKEANEPGGAHVLGVIPHNVIDGELQAVGDAGVLLSVSDAEDHQQSVFFPWTVVRSLRLAPDDES
jgi:hypothetical protein